MSDCDVGLANSRVFYAHYGIQTHEFGFGHMRVSLGRELHRFVVLIETASSPKQIGVPITDESDFYSPSTGSCMLLYPREADALRVYAALTGTPESEARPFPAAARDGDVVEAKLAEPESGVHVGGNYEIDSRAIVDGKVYYVFTRVDVDCDAGVLHPATHFELVERRSPLEKEDWVVVDSDDYVAHGLERGTLRRVIATTAGGRVFLNDDPLAHGYPAEIFRRV